MVALGARRRFRMAGLGEGGVAEVPLAGPVSSRGKTGRWTCLSSTSEAWKMRMNSGCRKKKTQATYVIHSRQILSIG